MSKNKNSYPLDFGNTYGVVHNERPFSIRALQSQLEKAKNGDLEVDARLDKEIQKYEDEIRTVEAASQPGCSPQQKEAAQKVMSKYLELSK
jgi:hypothetical protein